MAHPWHDLPAFADAANGLFNAVIEVPKGSNVKYELHKPTGLLRVDRILHGSIVYPANYGFIPRTFCADHDPLDVLVLGSEPVQALAVVEARAIGALRMVDEGRQDDKLVAIQVGDPHVADYNELSELPNHLAQQIRRFFADYKLLENKRVIVEDFLPATAAAEILNEACELYTESVGAPDPTAR